MKGIKTLVVLVVLAFAVLAGWKAGSYEVANLEFQGDMADLSTQNNGYSRYAVHRSDEDFRKAVILDAREHDIALQPSQVTVRRMGPETNPTMYLAAEYSVPVDVLGYTFTMHFNPTSEEKLF